MRTYNILTMEPLKLTYYRARLFRQPLMTAFWPEAVKGLFHQVSIEPVGCVFALMLYFTCFRAQYLKAAVIRMITRHGRKISWNLSIFLT